MRLKPFYFRAGFRTVCGIGRLLRVFFGGELGKGLSIVMVYIECIGRLAGGGDLGEWICEIIILDVAELSESIAMIEDVCLIGMDIM